MESCGEVKKTGFDASGTWVSTRRASNCFPTCIKNVYYCSSLMAAQMNALFNSFTYLKISNGVIQSQCWKVSTVSIIILLSYEVYIIIKSVDKFFLLLVLISCRSTTVRYLQNCCIFSDLHKVRMHLIPCVYYVVVAISKQSSIRFMSKYRECKLSYRHKPFH